MPTILNVFVMTKTFKMVGISRVKAMNKNIQNGGHKQCEGYVTLKEKLSRKFFFQCHIAFTLLMPTILNVFVITKTFKMVGISSVKAM